MLLLDHLRNSGRFRELGRIQYHSSTVIHADSGGNVLVIIDGPIPTITWRSSSSGAVTELYEQCRASKYGHLAHSFTPIRVLFAVTTVRAAAAACCQCR